MSIFNGTTIEKWLRALFIGIIGGLVIAWAKPYFELKTIQKYNFEQKRQELQVQIKDNLAGFIGAREDLISVELSRQKNPEYADMDPCLYQRKERYVERRDEYFHKLQRNFHEAHIYFSQDVIGLMEAFIAWHKPNRTLFIHELPPSEEYESWAEDINYAVEQDITS